MSGGVDPEPETSKLTRKVMRKFGVDEKTAAEIIVFSNVLALQKMEKWRRADKKSRSKKAEEN